MGRRVEAVPSFPAVRSVHAPEGAKRDGQYLFEIAGYTGLYSGQCVRDLMAEGIPAFREVAQPAR